jgi:hypothetical protein
MLALIVLPSHLQYELQDCGRIHMGSGVLTDLLASMEANMYLG